MNEKIIEKIRALLGKTVENGASQEEAIAAAAMAKRLMEKYKIDVSMIEQGFVIPGANMFAVWSELIFKLNQLRPLAADIGLLQGLFSLSNYETYFAYDNNIGRYCDEQIKSDLGKKGVKEAVAFPAHEKGKGVVRFNETAGSMAKDSVFNAASVVRRMTGLELSDYDLHINVIGGGNIDGPSAGTAILAAITSALTKRPLRQDVAVTGEISLYGHVRPVGGVFEKAYGAKQAGMKTLVIPAENKKDIPESHLGLSVHPVETAEEAFRLLFADGWKEEGDGDD